MSYEFTAQTTTTDILQQFDPDLNGKLAIVTGATSGLGKETVRSLAMYGCTVIMAARNANKLKDAKSEIIKQWDDGSFKVNQEALSANLIPMILDLSSFESIYNFCTRFNLEYNQALDFLFNNAGVMAIPQYTMTTDGYEQQIGVNHL